MRNTNLERNQNNLGNIYLTSRKFRQTGRSHYSRYPGCFCCKKIPKYTASPKLAQLRKLLSGCLFGSFLLQLASLCNTYWSLLLTVKVQTTHHFLFLKKTDRNSMYGAGCMGILYLQGSPAVVCESGYVKAKHS